MATRRRSSSALRRDTMSNETSSTITRTRLRAAKRKDADKKLPCPYCPKKAFRSDNWKRHMKTVHPQASIEANAGVTDNPPAARQTGNHSSPISDLSVVPKASTRSHDQAQSFSDVFGSTAENLEHQQYSQGTLFDVPASSMGDTSQQDPTVLSNIIWPLEVCSERPDIIISIGQPDPNDSDTEHILGCSKCWRRLLPRMFSKTWVDSGLSKAVQLNNLALVKYFLGIGADTQVKNYPKSSRWSYQTQQFTALHGALLHNWEDFDLEIRYKIVVALIEDGRSIDVCDNDGNTALNLPCADIDVAEVRLFRRRCTLLLLNAGADCNIPNYQRQLPLHSFFSRSVIYLLKDGNDEKSRILETLIQATKNLNSKDLNGNTSLHMASKHWPPAVGSLLEHGADAGITNIDGQLPIHFLFSGDFRSPGDKAMGLLIDATKSLNISDRNGRTLLHEVSKYSSYAVRLLLERGASPLKRDRWGRIPLHEARSAEIVRLLTENRAVTLIHRCNVRGMNPLHLAILTGKEDKVILEMLRLEPSLATELTDEDETCLHLICRRPFAGSGVLWTSFDEDSGIINEIEDAEYQSADDMLLYGEDLLDKGCSANMRDRFGRNALFLLVETVLSQFEFIHEARHEDLETHPRSLSQLIAAIELLLKRGTDLNCVDLKSRSVLGLVVSLLRPRESCATGPRLMRQDDRHDPGDKVHEMITVGGIWTLMCSIKDNGGKMTSEERLKLLEGTSRNENPMDCFSRLFYATIDYLDDGEPADIEP